MAFFAGRASGACNLYKSVIISRQSVALGGKPGFRDHISLHLRRRGDVMAFCIMLLVDTFVGPSVIEGVGVFAAEPIKAGQVIYHFDPCFDRLISRAELDTYPASIR